MPSKHLSSIKETKKEVIILELCPKGDFFNVIDKNHEKVNDDPTLKSIFTQICEGVQAIHEETNTAHLDLKLDNILIGQDFKVKICDFGLAQPLK
jgi:protein-serine/threonine kinase